MLFFYAGPHPGTRDWPELAAKAVAAALEGAPELPESHIAAARMHLQHATYDLAASELHTTLQMAPTCAPARAMLGTLQIESGRAELGIPNVELANELDPAQGWTLLSIARYHALRHRDDEALAILERVERETVGLQQPVAAFRARLAMWRGDRARLEEVMSNYGERASRTAELRWVVANAGLGRFSAAELESRFERAFDPRASARLVGLVRQMMAEALMFAGDVDAAMANIEAAHQRALIDLDWLERCPLLDPLRDRPAFATVRAEVESRAQAIWTV
jgi:serine/threonine-protein kinase